MDSFGERLKSEREDRGLSIQFVGETLGVDQDRLRALERNDFEALPDNAVMLGCLRAYAECLDVDADLMIEDYVQEREKCLQKLAEAVTVKSAELAKAVTAKTAESEPPAIRSDVGRRARLPRRLAVSVILVLVAVFGAWWMLSSDQTAPGMTATAGAVASSPNETSSTVDTGSFAMSAPVEGQPTSERRTQRSTPPTSAPSGPSIADCGVGTGVRKLQLVGRSDRFREGTQVWFWTNVQGGSPGDRIEHVWLQGGDEVLRVSLKIGGARWRTYSSKMLRRGSAGDWAVEARDDTGHLLARREFFTVP